MRAVVADGLGKGWVVRELPDPRPGNDDLLVRVEASGVCHTDIHLASDAAFGATFPRVPGHEFVGRVVDIGPEVQGWSVGDRVGVAWAQRWCGRCRMCSEQSYSFCEAGCDVTGGTVDGGHAELAVVDAAAAIVVPDGLPAAQLAPLLCSGYTVYSALRDTDVAPGDRVAVVGVGGLGHLAVQYARALGATVIAVTRDAEKGDELFRLGAAQVVVTSVAAAGAALRDAGGADVLLLMGNGCPPDILDGVRVGGRVALVTVNDDVLALSTRDAVFRRLKIVGSSPGSRQLLRQAIAFHAAVGAEVATETFPLESAPEVFDLVRGGGARYRAVLTPPA